MTQNKTSKFSSASPKKHIVSASRSKNSSDLKPVSFRLSPVEFAELTATAKAQHMSRSHLIKEAIERCKKDNIWRPGVFQNAADSLSIVPPAKLVSLSTNLLELAMVVELLLPQIRSKKTHENVTRLYQDARTSLESLRHDLGC